MQQLATKSKSGKAAARKPDAAASASPQTLPVFVFGADQPSKAGCACGGSCPQCRKRPRAQFKLAVSQPGDLFEREADRVAERVMRMPDPGVNKGTKGTEGTKRMVATGAVPAMIQRMVFVRPSESADDMKGLFNTICPGKFTTIKAAGAAQISADCSASDRSASKGCDCLCDVVHDTKRQYWIDVQSPTLANKSQELHDKTTKDVPDASVLPNTDGDRITMYPSSGSAVEIGAFQADGKPIWLENWRLLAHELCGHARLNQSYSGDRGCREEHNATIDTENEIAAEHGGAARGHFADPKQGESFFNATGDRSKVVFSLCDGLYFESPDAAHAPVIQRKAACACGGGCPRCRGREGTKGTKETQGTEEVRDSSLSGDIGPGRPLDAATRNFFEPRFGADFSRVRVHADARAADSARAADALAYTVGHDIVFGAGQYAPQTAAGKKLLAHELTHAVQQGAGPSAFPFVQRQPQQGTGATTQPASQPTTQPAAAAGWQGCPADQIDGLNSDLADAVAWVDEAVTDLQRTPLSDHTRGALGRYLSTEPTDITSTILPALQHILTELRGGPGNFQCQTQAQCDAAHPPGYAAWSTYPITLCDNYFTWTAVLMGGSSVRSGLLIHECAHHAGLHGDTYEFTWPFPGLSAAERLQNADSLVAFVLTNHYASLPPVTGPTGVEFHAGGGGLLQQGVPEPSFVVTADVQLPLALRVFHFFDLRSGVRVDVDSRGSVILSASLGPRFFAPPDVSAIPWYLDLSAGSAASLTGPARIVGPSAEARAGVQLGHFGASIDYRHIWNLLRANSDIDELTISGEIRF